MNGILMIKPLRDKVAAGQKTETRRTSKPNVKPGELLFLREPVYVYGQWVQSPKQSKSGKQRYEFKVLPGYHCQYEDNAPDPSMILKKGQLGKLGWAKRSPLHCRSVDARLFIEVVSVNEEETGEITDQDAINEGIEMQLRGFPPEFEKWFVSPSCDTPFVSAVGAFINLWESINGDFDVHQKVWVIKFKLADV